MAIAENRRNAWLQKRRRANDFPEILPGNIVVPRTARWTGIHAKSPTNCSCVMCGNPRRYWGTLTIGELKRHAAMNDELEDLHGETEC